MKSSNIISKATLTISFTLVLVLWPVFFIIVFPGFWTMIQKMNGVSIENVLDYDRDIASYIKGHDAELKFLTQEEISHLQDVRTLFAIASSALFLSIILSVVSSYLSRSHAKSVKSALMKTSAGVILFLTFLVILSLLNFQWLFIKFHEIFFTGNYYFPSDSMLKILYPDNFFRDIFTVYFLLTAAGCLAVWLASYRLKV